MIKNRHQFLNLLLHYVSDIIVMIMSDDNVLESKLDSMNVSLSIPSITKIFRFWIIQKFLDNKRADTWLCISNSIMQSKLHDKKNELLGSYTFFATKFQALTYSY